MKTAELEGAALDYWVARADGQEKPWGLRYPWDYHRKALRGMILCSNYSDEEAARRVKEGLEKTLTQYSTAWSAAGPLIEREGICILRNDDKTKWVGANKFAEIQFGPTPLIAAMRAFVASKFGDEVEDIPSC